MRISTHILDTALGKPAADVPVSLAQWHGSDWLQLNATTTDPDGRVRQLLPADQALEMGRYRVRFETGAYYDAQNSKGLYPYVDIVIDVREGEQNFHIPLLLTANGYTTYRGS